MIEKILDLLTGAYSENTLRAYRSDFAAFERFCAANGYGPFPACEESIAAWVAALAEERKRPATIKRYVTSIGLLHDYGRFQNPTKGIEVKLALRRASRALGTQQRQAAPINRELLEAMLATCSSDIHGLRDRLLLNLAYDTARRRSELTSLLIDDIEHGEAQPARLLLRRSKTDGYGRGLYLQISQNTAEALHCWLGKSGLNTGPILRGIKGSVIQPSMHPSQIARVLKKRAGLTGLEQEKVKLISGHSTRVGHAQDLLLSGASLPQIMIRGRWSKLETAMRYCEAATL